MARKYAKYDTDVESFNDKYGTNFSFEDVERGINKYNLLTHDFHVKLDKHLSNEDALYRMIFLTLWQKYVESYMEFYNKEIDCHEFANQFEILMDTYREANNTDLPHELGGWKDEIEMLEAMADVVENMSFDRNEYMVNKYLKGNIRLRDMRATLGELEDDIKSYNPDLGEGVICYDFAKVMTYVSALEQVVASRSGWWKFWHPFRNNAEQRDLRAMKDFLQSHTEHAEYIAAEALFEKSVKFAANNSINEYSESVNREEENYNRNLEEMAQEGMFYIGFKRYFIKDEPAPNEIPEGKHLVDKSLLKVNYVPNAENIEKELEELEKAQDHLNSMEKVDASNECSDYKSADGQTMKYHNYQFAKDVVANNIQKIKDVKADDVEKIKKNIDAALEDGLGIPENDKDQEAMKAEIDKMSQEEQEKFLKKLSDMQWNARNQKIMDDMENRMDVVGEYVEDNENNVYDDDNYDFHIEGEKVTIPNIIVSNEARRVQVNPEELKAAIEGNNANNDKADPYIEEANKSAISLNN